MPALKPATSSGPAENCKGDEHGTPLPPHKEEEEAKLPHKKNDLPGQQNNLPAPKTFLLSTCGNTERSEQVGGGRRGMLYCMGLEYGFLLQASSL